MLQNVVHVLVLAGSGTVAGVLFAVALSTAPALQAMPPGRYIEAHRLLGRNWDPTMPIIVLGTAAGAVCSAVLADGVAGLLFLLGAVLLAAVSAVSHLANVPINKRVRLLDPDGVPDDWDDPRPLWRHWNLLRTVLAQLALVVIAAAVVSG